MPKITVQGETSFDVEAGKRLVLALEDNGIDILHRCGGNARCTTCRVMFHAGEPETMTAAEHTKLTANEQLGIVRLSCQITCEHDMTVEPVLRLSTSEYDDAGGRPADHITPEPEWMDAPKG